MKGGTPESLTLFGVDVSFYASYALLSLLICAGTFAVVKALERSWIGLAMDVVRTDETAAAACRGPGHRAGAARER